jgi:protease IV
MLRLPYFLFVNLLVLMFYPLFVWRRKRACPSGAWLKVEIQGSVVELAPRVPFWRRARRPFALQALRRVIEASAGDPRVTGLLFEIDRLNCGSATATGLRELLLWAKQNSKRVIVYLPSGAGTRELYVASAADRILVGPETDVTALGFAIEAPYLKNALDRAGIRPEVFARGAYKTAGEPLLLQQMSAPQREQLGLLLDTAWDVLVDALASGRNLSRDAVERFINEGPWPAQGAVDHGFADGIVYPDALEKQLETRRKDGAPLVPAGRYARRRRIPWRSLPKPRIGVIEVHGPIVSEARGPMPVASEESVCEALEMAREDRGIRGALLHVDSRGGSALASDRMLHAVKRLAEKKPVVACLADSAASGGYMVAVGAHKIVAQPTTVTGSIGVVAARVVVEPLLERLGVSVEVVKRGARADMHSPTQSLEDGERAVIERQLDHVYRSFVHAVALGRNRELHEVDELAGGRIWSGRDAQARGLVDRLGGFDVALSEVKSLLGAGAERLEPVLVGPRRLRPSTVGLPRWVSEIRSQPAFSVLGPILPRSWHDVLALSSGRRDRSWLWAAVEEIDLGR